MSKTTILVAPLSWGLGHATRCIPIIRALQLHGFTPVLASDSQALEVLREEFPDLTAIELPSYQIRYPRNSKWLVAALLFRFPYFIRTAIAEYKQTQQIIQQYQISGIISDNRYGVFSSKVPSVFLTHQVNLLSGVFTRLSSFLHRTVLRLYDQIWVPDSKGEFNLSGNLSNPKKSQLPITFIGNLSRMNHRDKPYLYDLAVVLSGPEPQRSILHDKLLKELEGFAGKLVFVAGSTSAKMPENLPTNITYYDYCDSSHLNQLLNQSKVVLSRSGYSSMMDHLALGKKVFYIPTPGQTEQEYLARRMKELGIAPYATQTCFTLNQLKEIERYSGFRVVFNPQDWKSIFGVFTEKN